MIFNECADAQIFQAFLSISKFLRSIFPFVTVNWNFLISHPCVVRKFCCLDRIFAEEFFISSFQKKKKVKSINVTMIFPNLRGRATSVPNFSSCFSLVDFQINLF